MFMQKHNTFLTVAMLLCDLNSQSRSSWHFIL